MGDPRELEWAKKPDALKESWTARIGTHMVHGIPLTDLGLPYLKELLIANFTGADETWTCFTSEFSPGGLIDAATTEERNLAWMPATNDENEGALGSFRKLI